MDGTRHAYPERGGAGSRASIRAWYPYRKKLQDALNKAEGTQKLGALAMANLGTQVALTAITLPAPVLGMPIMAGGIAVNAAALGPMNEEM